MAGLDLNLESLSRNEAISIGALGGIIYIIVNMIDESSKSTPAVIFFLVILITLRLLSRYRKRAFFWIFMILTMLIHIIAVVFLSWNMEDVYGPVLIPVGLIDVWVILSIFKFISLVFEH